MIDELSAEITLGNLSTHWTGNELAISFTGSSQDEVNQIIFSMNHMLPAFLSLRLRVFVWIREFVVHIGNAHFKLETQGHRFGITIATTEHNSEAATRSLQDWTLTRQEHLRLVMGIYYYRHAQRLNTLEPDRQSMAAEVTLNLAKSIEIVFSSNRDKLRSMANEWGLDSEFIERWIIPILLVRNELNVGHATSAPLTGEQQQSILRFLDRAFWHVHILLQNLVEKVHSGEIKLDPPADGMDEDKEQLLRRIEAYATAE